VPWSFSPRGFGDDKKQRAEYAEMQMGRAAALLGLAAAGSMFVFPPLAGGLGLAAAVGPVLSFPLQRIRRDPPRRDFYEAVIVPPPSLDPTAVFGDEIDPLQYPAGFVSGVVAYSLGVERTAVHAGAMVTAVERAMGAYAAGSSVALELRVAEASHHARRALSAATVLEPAIAPLRAFIFDDNAGFRDAIGQLDPSQTFEQHLADRSVASRLAETGVADAFLLERPLAEGLSLDEFNPHVLDQAVSSVHDLMSSIVGELPDSVGEFVAAGEDSDAAAGA
jgi:hypothetical protein